MSVIVRVFVGLTLLMLLDGLLDGWIRMVVLIVEDTVRHILKRFICLEQGSVLVGSYPLGSLLDAIDRAILIEKLLLL